MGSEELATGSGEN